MQSKRSDNVKMLWAVPAEPQYLKISALGVSRQAFRCCFGSLGVNRPMHSNARIPPENVRTKEGA
jgi:hypothetical protein